MAKRHKNKKVVEYSEEFKAIIVRVSEIESVQIKQIGERLDLHPFMISRWRKQSRDGELNHNLSSLYMSKEKPPPRGKERAELEQLRKQNKRLKKENDVLKKWQRYLKEAKQNDSGS